MPSRWRESLRSARFRILASMLAVAALGMTVAGLAAYLIQRERVLAEIDDRLTLTVEGLQFLAEGGDPAADAEPPTTVEEFLTLAMTRVLPDHNESTLGIVDGVARFLPSSAIRFRLTDDPAFIERIVAESDPDRVVRGTADTAVGTLRYVTIPVTIQDDPSTGLYVSAYDLGAELAEIDQAFRTYALFAAVALVLVGLVGWFVSGRLLRPLRLLRKTAAEIGENDLQARIPARGTDDVSELSRAFNAMLDRLQRSFDTQRQLLDDVSHELRTPITIVRGHLELLDPDAPGEVTTTRHLAIEELDRMNGLVDDIALLVKTSRPDFLRREPTDVADLTEQVLRKARALSPAHEWGHAGSAHVSADLDPSRITQAWLQLAENAAKYAPAGTLISIGSVLVREQEGTAVELWVRDHGPGIPQHQLDWIFDRFARVEVGRGAEGSGLGLSIVSAIAAAHGGRAYARNPTGGGARVAISLPLSAHDEEEPDAAHPDR
ncbi:cell wall metabolism sensor histidine kinase WalK [Homoserinibacter sp. GY 40078]|uniref:sensor histidine kinase n=1 Tax=Homoserinibacter sp. GY 40078 TaxID=2603275 RepID=UPI0011CAF51D|nr:HAMP domain-containing sensor histidine kinase [Homoserinibacter sp. GY 40078]TXK16285.1 HAMP domain-containing histidine kinase [Homoserinibacter sp. GY 40078]